MPLIQASGPAENIARKLHCLLKDRTDAVRPEIWGDDRLKIDTGRPCRTEAMAAVAEMLA